MLHVQLQSRGLRVQLQSGCKVGIRVLASSWCRHVESEAVWTCVLHYSRTLRHHPGVVLGPQGGPPPGGSQPGPPHCRCYRSVTHVVWSYMAHPNGCRHEVIFLPRPRRYPIKWRWLLWVSQHAPAHQPVARLPVKILLLTVVFAVKFIALISAGLSMVGLSKMSCLMVHGPEMVSSAAHYYTAKVCLSDQLGVQGNHDSLMGALSSAQFICEVILALLQYSCTSLPLLHARDGTQRQGS